MDVSAYVEDIGRQLDAAATAIGEDAQALAQRLGRPLEAAIRLALQDALAAAAEEITTEMAPGSVEVRLRGRELQFVVVPPPADPTRDGPEGRDDLAPAGAPLEDTGAHDVGSGGDTVARINLRLPEQLKARVEQAAESEGLSINAWLVRAVRSALDRSARDATRERRPPYGAQRYTGWAR